MKHSKVAPLAGASALLMLLAGCASEPAEPTYDEPVDLTMVVWTANEPMKAEFVALADEFREDNPELGKFTIETIPFEDYIGQITIRLSGGQAPDIGWTVESSTPALLDAGIMYDISALKDDPDWEFDDIIPGTYAALEKDGALFGYPFANTTHPITYNKTAFEAAGLKTPLELYDEGDWTWDTLRESAKGLVDAGVVTYGFDIPQFAYSNYALFTPVMKGFGAVAYPGGNECGYDSDESLAAFEYLHSMVFDDKSFPGPGSTSSFPTGDTGMYLGAPSTLSTLTDIDFDFEVVPQPEGVNGLDPFLGQASMYAFADGQAPELATRLLAYFTGPVGAAALEKFNVPPRSSLLTPDLVAQLNPLLTPDAADRSLIKPLDVAVQIDYPVAYPELESTLRPILDAVWQPGADIEDALSKACAAADPILAAQ